jgi:Zn-dependent protease
MVFIPFMGAVISMKDSPRNAHEEAMIAFGGPVAGTLSAISVSLAGHYLDSQLLYALADFGFMINLFNMLPIGSMDGGRMADCVSPYLGAAGVVGGAGLVYVGAVHNPIFYLILLSGGYTSAKRLFGNKQHAPCTTECTYFLVQ